MDLGIETHGICLEPPFAYLEMVAALDRCGSVITDSGGVQEETTALGVPCFTLRDTTERPITISEGTNTLVRDLDRLADLVRTARRSDSVKRPDGWDGCAAGRIVDALVANSPISGCAPAASRALAQ